MFDAFVIGTSVELVTLRIGSIMGSGITTGSGSGVGSGSGSGTGLGFICYPVPGTPVYTTLKVKNALPTDLDSITRYKLRPLLAVKVYPACTSLYILVARSSDCPLITVPSVLMIYSIVTYRTSF